MCTWRRPGLSLSTLREHPNKRGQEPLRNKQGQEPLRKSRSRSTSFIVVRPPGELGGLGGLRLPPLSRRFLAFAGADATRHGPEDAGGVAQYVLLLDKNYPPSSLRDAATSLQERRGASPPLRAISMSPLFASGHARAIHLKGEAGYANPKQSGHRETHRLRGEESPAVAVERGGFLQHGFAEGTPGSGYSDDRAMHVWNMSCAAQVKVGEIIQLGRISFPRRGRRRSCPLARPSSSSVSPHPRGRIRTRT